MSAFSCFDRSAASALFAFAIAGFNAAAVAATPPDAADPAAASTPLLLAQATPAAAPAKKEAAATELEKVEVTGSRIKRVDLEGATPLAVVTREQIDKLGYTTVKDVLGNLSYNAGGTFGNGQSFSFARGTESIDLRGFGAGRTLILMDGRRLPVFPQGLGGTDAFVDLSTIPASIIERVEILLGGGSAIYGSDAISGVVNIITRKSANGTEFSARVSDTDDGGGATRRFSFLQGLSSGKTEMLFGGEYAKQDVLRFVDRDFSESDFGNGGNASGFGNTFFGDNGAVIRDPNCGTEADAIGGRGEPRGASCRFDRSRFRQWIPESDKGSLFLRADRKFGDIDTFLRLGASRTELSFELEPNAYAGGESLGFTSNRIIGNEFFDPINGPGYVAAGAVNNPTTGTGDEQGGFFFRRLTEFGPRGGDQIQQNYNGLLGLSGQFRDYTWEIGFGHNEQRIEIETPTILSSVLDNEVSNRGLNLFDPIPANILARASHTQFQQATTRNNTVDATVSGPVGLQLSGGPIQFALHADYERQRYRDSVDAVSTLGDVFDGGSSGGGSRKYSGVGLEFSLPVLSNLEFNVASRFDSYADDSDTGSAFSPSVSLSYRPLEIVLVRASYGEIFRAPDLQRLFGGATNGFETVFDTPLCVAAGGTPGNAIDPNDPDDPCLSIQSVPSVTGSNRDLKEEEGETFNVGVVVEPLKNLTLSVDYYEIRLNDIVSNLDAQQLLDLCATSGTFCDQIRRNPVTNLLGLPSAGGDNAALINAGALNLASEESHGLDMAARYNFTLKNLGKFSTDFNWSRVTSFRVKSQPGDEEVQQLGFGQTILIPKNRYSLTNDWSLDKYGATLRIDRVGKYPGSNSLTAPATSDQFVSRYTTVGLQGRVDFGKFGLVRLGVDNLFDEDFPLDPTFTEQAGTPNVQNQFLGEATSFYANPLGRQGYIQYELSF